MSTAPTTESLPQPELASSAPEAQASQASTSFAGGAPPAAQHPQPPIGDSEDKIESEGSPWETCLNYAKDHVQVETELWKGEIDNLLIFASLFSAVVGSFAIESYHSVQQDPADTTVLLLKSLLALQLNATNPQPNLPIDLDPQIPITSAARRINIYNFLSLILSLSVVVGGILCLQWLREYGQDPEGIPAPRRELLGIRFMRREGMENWHVFAVLRWLPFILLFSLLLFFAGIIELLVEVDKTATIVASIVIGITALFMLGTTTLPTLQAFLFPNHSQCPYKSPQAWLFYQIAGPICRLALAMFKFVKRPRWNNSGDTSIFDLQNWSDYDWLMYTRHTNTTRPGPISNIGFGLHWLGKMYLQETKFTEALYNCIQDTSIHEMLRGILSMKDPRRYTSAQKALNWSPPPAPNAQELKDGHVADVTVFQTLAHLADKIEQGHHATVLVRTRLRLFLKINQQLPDQNIDCPMIHALDQEDIVADDTRKALLHYISQLMDGHMDVNESHLSALDIILVLESDMPHPDLELFISTYRALEGWMKHKGWDTDEELSDSKTRLEAEAFRLRNRIDILRKLVSSRQPSSA